MSVNVNVMKPAIMRNNPVTPRWLTGHPSVKRSPCRTYATVSQAASPRPAAKSAALTATARVYENRANHFSTVWPE